MTDKEKIRAEIEQLMYGYNLEADIASCEDAEAEKLADIKYQLCKKILEYINSLQEEPVSEELEKVADQYSQGIESDYINDMFDRGDIYEAVIYGAQWQKQQIIQKACKWLDGNTSPYFTIIKDPGLAKVNINFFNDKFLEDFRKAMED